MSAHGLMFHHLHDHKKHQARQGSITADEFTRIIIYYKKKYNILSAIDWYERAITNKLSQKDICITFDDTLRSQFDIALPVLEMFDIKAFWFICTQPLDGIAEKNELYNYYQVSEFSCFKEFYTEFKNFVSRTEFKKIVEDGLKYFQPDKYLKECSFYSLEEKVFRYIRDRIIERKNYQKIMDNMISSWDIDKKRILDLLWMNKKCIETLRDKQHIIGLHSHTHPTALEKMGKEEQEIEYKTNYSKLKDITKDEIVTMSHPCNSYNNNTLGILMNMKIKIGFRANMIKLKHSNLEFPRLDHAYLIKKIRK